jgi:hypothetical protein
MRTALVFLVAFCVGCGDDSESAVSADSGTAHANPGDGGTRPGRDKPDSVSRDAAEPPHKPTPGSTPGTDMLGPERGDDLRPATLDEDAGHPIASGTTNEPGVSAAEAPEAGVAKPSTAAEHDGGGTRSDLPSTDDTAEAGSAGPDSIYGDIGASCDPTLESGCAVTCLGLSDGSGVCIDVCGVGRGCPEGFACNTLPYDGAIYDICLPNTSCGDLDYKGECQGDTLRYCGTEGPLEVDCSQGSSPEGAPLTCGLIDPELGYDCISPVFTGGCGDETEEGRCDGDKLIYCASQQSGEVETVDCSLDGRVCGPGPNGYVDCLEPATTGCGTVTVEGQCEGLHLTYCQDSEIVSGDCETACQWRSDEVGYDCWTPPSAAGAQSVQGVVGFEKRLPTLDGLGDPTVVPARHILVRVLDSGDGSELGRAYSQQDGSYAVSFDAPADVFVQFRTVGDPAEYPMNVRDCPLLDCEQDGTYFVNSGAFTPGADMDLGTAVITVDIGAGAFNIFDQVVRGFDFARANFGSTPPYAIVRWADGQNTLCGSSCFIAKLDTLFIKGALEDPDQYDDAVLLHEFGHYLENSFSHSDSPGGPHDGSPTDPRLAWGEGYGTYVGARIADSPLYIDTGAAGSMVIDLRDVGEELYADPSDVRGLNQLISEEMVAQLLWQVDYGIPNLTTAHGSEPTFDVLGQYFPNPQRFADRGVSGVDLVDFLDGWFCRNHGDVDGIRTIVTGVGFPYDFPSLQSCQ